MTTVQTMLARSGRVRAGAALAAAAALALGTGVIGGCAQKPALVPPEVLVSPYGAEGGGALWVVPPLLNESGTTLADGMAVGDALINKINEVEGLAAIPMNRTLLAMRALNMRAVLSPADARMLAEALGADGVIVGTITSYDPYNPPKLGLALALFGRSGAAREPIDPASLRGAYTDAGTVTLSEYAERPLAVVNEQFEGSNHGVQMSVQRYATGRIEGENALGWKRYLASMELYTDFAAFQAVRRLLDEERLRLAREGRPRTAAAR